MNNKGFSLVELLATLVILGIVMSIVLVSVNGGFGEAKNKTEDIFIGTLRDAMDMYLDSDAKKLSFNTSPCPNFISKTNGDIKVYSTSKIDFQDVINSKYKPITESDLVNPVNNEKCEHLEFVIYRDEDFVYYYRLDVSDCITGFDYIDNLPKGFECE